GATEIAHHGNVTWKTKHIALCLNFISEINDQGIIKINGISTNDNPADILTKPLPHFSFKKHLDVLLN
ncbi:hypothetical protein HMI54_008355, partial [Coelomomyces lativittatus]